MPSGSKIAVIVNPQSAGGKTARRWPGIARRLEQRLGAVTTRFTERPGHATELTRELLRQGFDLIISAGGDGTCNEIANGFIQADELVRPGACMGVLPAGTGGDFQRMFRSSSRSGIDVAIEAFAHGQPWPIDIGKARFLSHAGAMSERYFVNLVSFGMGGAVAARARNLLAPLGGKAAFLWAFFRVLLSYQGKEVKVRVNGAAAPTAYCVTNVAVGNGRFHGGGMLPCPTAVLDDGILEVTVIEYMNAVQLLWEIGVLYSGKVYRLPKVHHLRGTRIDATAETSTLIEIDGEPLGSLPLEIVVLPKRLPVMIKPVR